MTLSEALGVLEDAVKKVESEDFVVEGHLEIRTEGEKFIGSTDLFCGPIELMEFEELEQEKGKGGE